MASRRTCWRISPPSWSGCNSSRGVGTERAPASRQDRRRSRRPRPRRRVRCDRWLRLLSEWVGSDGEVVGIDIEDAMLAAAGQFVDTEGLGNVVLTKDELFASKLESSSFDLVHARFQIAPLGVDQTRSPPPPTPPAGRHGGAGGAGCELVAFQPSCGRLGEPGRAHRAVVRAARRRHPGRLKLLDLLRGFDIEGNVRAEVLALPPGHPYLRRPLQFATALEERLLPW